MNTLAERLAENGIRPSYQRLRIFALLSGTVAHPSAETIFRELSPDIPSLSRTTVYSTLALLVKAGLAVTVRIDDDGIRYDADTSVHGHFRCARCGKVYDFPVKPGSLKPELPPGFTASLVQLCCEGTCATCAALAEQPRD